MYALFTIYNESFAQLNSHTWNKNKLLYAKQHDYETFVRDDWTSNYDRIYQIKNIFETRPDISWIWYTDSDVIVTNFQTTIESKIVSTHHVVVSTDVNGINCGSMLLRNSPQTISFLTDIIGIEDMAQEHWDKEQWAFSNLCGFPETCDPAWPSGKNLVVADKYKDIVYIVPQRYLNSYDYSLYPWHKDTRDKLLEDGNWLLGDWALHWPGVTIDTRLSLFDKIQTNIHR
jgi:hypothetical protein